MNQNRLQGWWTENITRTQHALILAGAFFATWILIWTVLGEDSLVRATGIGGISALVFGGIHYILDTR